MKPKRVTSALKATPFEWELLAIVLREWRSTMREKSPGQLHVTIDPFHPAHGEGAYVFAAPNAVGKTYEVVPPNRPSLRLGRK